MTALLKINPKEFRSEPNPRSSNALTFVDVTDGARSSRGFAGHELVIEAHNPSVGFHALIALHDRTLGPAIGGCRIWRYENRAEALTDVLRLSQGMTLKASIAGVAAGGGKAVIMEGPGFRKTPELFHALGATLNVLQGRFYTGQDVGVSKADVLHIAEASEYSLGVSGDPSPMTAYGVETGILAAVRHRLRRGDLKGLRIAVQGLGKVGYALSRLLYEDGANLVVADIDEALALGAEAEFCATVVDSGEIHRVEVDVFAPCALGGGLDHETIPKLNCAVVAGAANNPLEDEATDGQALAAAAIVYAPAYVINAGGIINISHEGRLYNREAAMAHCARIHDTLAEIFQRAEQEGRPTNEVADQLAEERIADHAATARNSLRAATG